jgi:tripartite-type tricarboxylate transporter receptor subunit TctC
VHEDPLWAGTVNLPRRTFLHLAAGAAVLPAVSRFARAQSYPSKPITMVVPFAAGGGSDATGRILAERMRVSLGQPVIVEIITGANGSIGTGRVRRAPPDGYTIVSGNWNTHVANGALYALPYDVQKDFEPIVLFARNPFVFVSKKALPAHDLQGLIAWLKANPGKASLGTAGPGSPAHVSGVSFQNITGTRFQLVPYRGGDGQAMQDLVAGQIDLMIAAPTASLPQVRAGLIKAYAVADKGRLPAAPDIPSVDEAGLPGFYVSNWYAFFAPKGIPREVIAKLNGAVVDALADPRVRVRFADQGQEIPPRDQQTPDSLAGFQKAEIENWWPIIKAANIKAE